MITHLHPRAHLLRVDLVAVVQAEHTKLGPHPLSERAHFPKRSPKEAFPGLDLVNKADVPNT